MKTKKQFLSISLIVFAIFGFVGCSSSNVLDDVLDATDSLTGITDSYLEDNLGAMNSLQELSFDDNHYLVIQLDDSPTNLQLFNELRLQLIDLHEQILAERVVLQELKESIKTSVTALKENDYRLLADDRTLVKEHIQNLKTFREDLIATQGEAYAKIYELRGTYTIDNIEHIISVFQDVKIVLEYRLEIMQDSEIDIESINQLLLEYLEN